MGLHSKAAEGLSKVHHRQMLLLVSGTYRRFILSTLSWNIVKDQKTGLINFMRENVIFPSYSSAIFPIWSILEGLEGLEQSYYH